MGGFVAKMTAFRIVYFKNTVEILLNPITPRPKTSMELI